MNVHSDIMYTLDEENLALLILLQFSAVLFSRFNQVYGIDGTALKLTASYLTNHYQSVFVGIETSAPAPLESGVLHSLVIGPKFYIKYTKALGDLIRHHGLDYHTHPNNT